MSTECIASKLEFQGLDGRRVEAEFNGGQITSDAGGWYCQVKWNSRVLEAKPVVGRT